MLLFTEKLAGFSQRYIFYIIGEASATEYTTQGSTIHHSFYFLTLFANKQPILFNNQPNKRSNQCAKQKFLLVTSPSVWWPKTQKASIFLRHKTALNHLDYVQKLPLHTRSTKFSRKKTSDTPIAPASKNTVMLTETETGHQRRGTSPSEPKPNSPSFVSYDDHQRRECDKR